MELVDQAIAVVVNVVQTGPFDLLTAIITAYARISGHWVAMAIVNRKTMLLIQGLASLVQDFTILTLIPFGAGHGAVLPHRYISAIASASYQPCESEAEMIDFSRDGVV